jgi:hypothetical protein
MCLSYNSEFWYYHLFCCFINGSLLFCGPPFRAFKGTVGCGWETGTQGVLHYHVCREAARIFFGWPKKVEFWYLGANHAAHVTFPSLPFYKWCVFIAIVLYVGRCLIFFSSSEDKAPTIKATCYPSDHPAGQLVDFMDAKCCLLSRSCHLARRRNRRWFRRRDRGRRGAGKMQDRSAR